MKLAIKVEDLYTEIIKNTQGRPGPDMNRIDRLIALSKIKKKNT